MNSLVFHDFCNPSKSLDGLPQLRTDICVGSLRGISFNVFQDGVITDLQETKDAIVNASDLPLSILILGVGGADFKEMEVHAC